MLAFQPALKPVSAFCILYVHLEILTCAGENNIDLIIMGSHTKEKPGKWYPGSAVERVAYRAACPAVVVTDPGALTHWDLTVSADDGEGKDRLIRVFSGP